MGNLHPPSIAVLRVRLAGSGRGCAPHIGIQLDDEMIVLLGGATLSVVGCGRFELDAVKDGNVLLLLRLLLLLMERSLLLRKGVVGVKGLRRMVKEV